MQVELTIGMIISVIGLIISGTSFFIARTNDTKKLEARLTKLELKIEPFWKFVQTEIPKLIMQEDTPALDTLLEEHMNGGIECPDKKQTLITLLKHEYSRAKIEEKTGRGFAIGLMILSLETNQIK